MTSSTKFGGGVRNRTPTEHQSPVPAALQPPSAPAQTHDPLRVVDSSPLPAFAAGSALKNSCKNAALWLENAPPRGPFQGNGANSFKRLAAPHRGRAA